MPPVKARVWPPGWLRAGRDPGSFRPTDPVAKAQAQVAEADADITEPIRGELFVGWLALVNDGRRRGSHHPGRSRRPGIAEPDAQLEMIALPPGHVYVMGVHELPGRDAHPQAELVALPG